LIVSKLALETLTVSWSPLPRVIVSWPDKQAIEKAAKLFNVPQFPRLASCR
jgi:hypothetical protein